jgi:hypothetical protein
MKTLQQNVLIPGQPATPDRIEQQTLYGCDQCDFTSPGKSDIEQHTRNTHTFTESQGPITGPDGDKQVFRKFETKEAFDAFNGPDEVRYATCRFDWDGPGWYLYTADESGDHAYYTHRSTTSIIADAKETIADLQRYIEVIPT